MKHFKTFYDMFLVSATNIPEEKCNSTFYYESFSQSPRLMQNTTILNTDFITGVLTKFTLKSVGYGETIWSSQKFCQKCEFVNVCSTLSNKVTGK